MVAADRSGVAFTINPVTGTNEIVINASYGLGDLLVSGAITPDEVVVGRTGGVPTVIVGSKREMTILTRDGVLRMAVPISLQAASCLSNDQIMSVAAAARTCEEHLGYPVDIEWAVSGKALFILQARPITAITNKGADGHD